MIISFISIIPSSNNIAKAKMLAVAILTMDDERIVSQFESFIKPVPRLSLVERHALAIEYNLLTSAAPLSDVAPEIIGAIENNQTVFWDKLSESVFKKAFREIGYPLGGGTLLLEKIYKKALKPNQPFSLEDALKTMQLEQSVLTTLDCCKAMEKIFSALYSAEPPNLFSAKLEMPIRKSQSILPGNLPTAPGVYFFRDSEGEVIYVGKAKNIRKRVRSHFSSTLKFEVELCAQTQIVDFEETGNETIALLLEANYINDLKPTFNSLQKEIIDPFIVTSKMDSKGILRIQILQKSYKDSENEFYYNRDSVIQKIKEIQQKFNLCRRFTGLERTSSKCSDPVFCKGICSDLEDREIYNRRVKEALAHIYAQRPSYIIRLKGRNLYEHGIILVKNGIYQGFGFIEVDANINSILDMEGYIKRFQHNYFTSRILDQYFKNTRNAAQNLIAFENI